jgi:hypothetical protein
VTILNSSDINKLIPVTDLSSALNEGGSFDEEEKTKDANTAGAKSDDIAE